MAAVYITIYIQRTLPKINEERSVQGQINQTIPLTFFSFIITVCIWLVRLLFFRLKFIVKHFRKGFDIIPKKSIYKLKPWKHSRVVCMSVWRHSVQDTYIRTNHHCMYTWCAQYQN